MGDINIAIVLFDQDIFADLVSNGVISRSRPKYLQSASPIYENVVEAEL